jgi:hypothetical protein
MAHLVVIHQGCGLKPGVALRQIAGKGFGAQSDGACGSFVVADEPSDAPAVTQLGRPVERSEVYSRERGFP